MLIQPVPDLYLESLFRYLVSSWTSLFLYLTNDLSRSSLSQSRGYANVILSMSGDWKLTWFLRLFEIFLVKYTDAGLFSVLPPPPPRIFAIRQIAVKVLLLEGKRFPRVMGCSGCCGIHPGHWSSYRFITYDVLPSGRVSAASPLALFPQTCWQAGIVWLQEYSYTFLRLSTNTIL